MSEEKDKKLKSKSALIKHKKADDGIAAVSGAASVHDDKQDKKRVVIVKKRVLKLKKDPDDSEPAKNPEEIVVQQKEERPAEPAETKEKKTVPEANTPKEYKEEEPKSRPRINLSNENKEPEPEEQAKLTKQERAEKPGKPDEAARMHGLSATHRVAQPEGAADEVRDQARMHGQPATHRVAQPEGIADDARDQARMHGQPATRRVAQPEGTADDARDQARMHGQPATRRVAQPEGTADEIVRDPSRGHKGPIGEHRDPMGEHRDPIGEHNQAGKDEKTNRSDKPDQPGEKKQAKSHGFLGASPREPSPYERYGKKRPDFAGPQKKPASGDEIDENETGAAKRDAFDKKHGRPFSGPHAQQRKPPQSETNAPYDAARANPADDTARTDTQFRTPHGQGGRRPQQDSSRGPARQDFTARRGAPGRPPGKPPFVDNRSRGFKPDEKGERTERGDNRGGTFQKDFKRDAFGGRGRGPRPAGPMKGPKGTKEATPAGDGTGLDKGKTGAKKFFKTKKKTVYPKKKENFEQGQKILQQSKKKVIKQANPVPKEISILESISVSELARKMNLKANELIAKLMSMGVMVSINQPIDSDTASILADEYGCKAKVVSLYDETVIEEEKNDNEELIPRPPIVSVMGHVDHGKTKLLDAIRMTNVVATEHGGITQHIGAYTVDLPQGKIVFLDTPGHEAFTSMRARGAQVTDIVVLVVAADDGVMPQTVEAINHAKAADVPIIVAINKVDLPDANPERVKKQLTDYGLLPEEWGGHTLFNEVSALKKIGIDNLLTTILLQAEMLEIKSCYTCRAAGRVIESKVDLGRGIVATVLVERGTLEVGQSFIAGVYPGRVRAMFDDKGEKLEKATPSIPVEILGFTGLPNAGDPFQVTENEKSARQIAVKRQELKKMEDAKNVTKVTLDNLYEQIKQGEVQELKVIVKGDVNGSVEALTSSLERLSTKEIRLNVIHASAGAINYGDVLLAATYNAIIVGFHVRPTVSAIALAEREKVEIRKYSIIYDAIDDIRSAMEGLLAPELKEETLGIAEIRDTFKVPKIGLIAGCYVVSGKIKRGAKAHVIRDGVEIFEGRIASLKRFKDDAREVETGFECGIGIENYNDLKVGDQIEAYEIKELAKKLGVDSSSNVGSKKEED